MLFTNCYNISVFIASTSICKSQLRFVSCGVFTQLNENSDSDSAIGPHSKGGQSPGGCLMTESHSTIQRSHTELTIDIIIQLYYYIYVANQRNLKFVLYIGPSL